MPFCQKHMGQTEAGLNSGRVLILSGHNSGILPYMVKYTNVLLVTSYTATFTLISC